MTHSLLQLRFVATISLQPAQLTCVAAALLAHSWGLQSARPHYVNASPCACSQTQHAPLQLARHPAPPVMGSCSPPGTPPNPELHVRAGMPLGVAAIAVGGCLGGVKAAADTEPIAAGTLCCILTALVHRPLISWAAALPLPSAGDTKTLWRGFCTLQHHGPAGPAWSLPKSKCTSAGTAQWLSEIGLSRHMHGGAPA